MSPKYQSLLNVDREGTLRRDPFGELYEFQIKDWYDHGFSYNAGPFQKNNNSTSQKLESARKMHKLERIIRHEKDPNKRGQARIKYAIGLRNSFNICWALTFYSRGSCFVAARNELTDWENQNLEWPYKNPIKYEHLVIQADKDAQTMILQSLAELTDSEIATAAYYRLYEYKTVAKHYPNTKIGRILATKCDNWHNWIK